MELALSATSDVVRTVVHVGGEVDVYTAPSLRRFLDEQIHDGARDVVVDLSEVGFLDSTGLGVLVGRLKLLRANGGTLRLVGLGERVLRVFTITGLDRVFEFAPSIEELDAQADRDR